MIRGSYFDTQGKSLRHFLIEVNQPISDNVLIDILYREIPLLNLFDSNHHRGFILRNLRVYYFESLDIILQHPLQISILDF